MVLGERELSRQSSSSPRANAPKERSKGLRVELRGRQLLDQAANVGMNSLGFSPTAPRMPR